MTPLPTDDGRGRDVLIEVELAIAELQAHADPAVRAAAATLLEGIDAVHRTGLTHLVHAIRGMTGDTLVNRLIADPAIRMLLMSYDLIAVDRRVQAEEAVDTVRGHLHDHGVDVEIQDVVGGVVYAKLHVAATGGGEPPAEPRIRADLEAALREYLIGFQELELGGRGAPGRPSAVVPLSSLRAAARPVYEPALAEPDLEEGTMRAVEVNGVSILFARVAGQVYAIRNQCGDSPLPLDLGAIEGNEIRCAFHGCRYDVRSGRRLDGEGRVQVLPVRVEDGQVQVAIDVAAPGEALPQTGEPGSRGGPQAGLSQGPAAASSCRAPRGETA
jgi:nitrite reductase/ring-hydroxylating ferredoxin subunit